MYIVNKNVLTYISQGHRQGLPLITCTYSPRARKFKGSEGNSSVSDSHQTENIQLFHAYARKKQYEDFKTVPL